MAANVRQGGPRVTESGRGVGFWAWALAIAVLAALCLTWILYSETPRSTAPRLALPSASRDLPTMPNPEPMPLPSGRPISR